MKYYHHTWHRQEGENWMVGKNSQMISFSRFFKTYFRIYLFTIIFLFFQTLFSTHNGSTSNPCCYWIFSPSHLVFSFCFSPTFFFYYLNALLSWFYLWYHQQCTSLGTGFEEGQKGPLQVWLQVKPLGCLRKCSRQLEWAKRLTWTLTVAEAVSIILFTKL